MLPGLSGGGPGPVMSPVPFAVPAVSSGKELGGWRGGGGMLTACDAAGKGAASDDVTAWRTYEEAERFIESKPARGWFCRSHFRVMKTVQFFFFQRDIIRAVVVEER